MKDIIKDLIKKSLKKIDKDKVDLNKKLPIFKEGSIKGGLIIEKKIQKEYYKQRSYKKM